MTWLLAALVAILFVELLARLPLMPAVRHLLATAGRVRRVIASPRISDHWKEKTLVVYAGRLLGQSLKISALLALAGAAVAIAAYALAQPLDSGLEAFLLSLEGIAFASLVSFGYFFARSRFSGARSDRSRLVPRQL